MKLKIKRNLDFLNYIYIFILGFFGFSYLSQYMLLNVLNFPFFFVELFFIPLICKYWYPTFKTFIHKNSAGLSFLFFLILVSSIMCVVNTNSFTNLLEYRSILYLILAFCYVNRNGVDIDLQHIMYVSIFSVLSELMFVLILNDDATVSSMNMLTIGASIILPFMLEKYIIGIGMFGISLVSGITSGYRIGIVIAAVSLIVSLGYMVVRNDNIKNSSTRVKRLFIVVFLILMSVILILNYIPIVEFLSEKLGMDSFAVFRVTSRLTNLLRGDFGAAQEGLRLAVMVLPFEQFLDYWFPLGLDSMFIPLYTDVPIMYFYSIFGSVVSWVLCIGVFMKAVTKMPLLFQKIETSIEKSDTRYEVFALLMFPVLLTSFIVNGTFFLNTYQAIFTGVVLGFLFSKKVKEAENKCKEK